MDRGADAAGQRHLGDGDQQPAVGDVVAGAHPALLDQRADEVAAPPLRREVDRWRRALFPALDLAQVERLAEPAVPLAAADQQQRLAFRLQRDGRHARPGRANRPTPPTVGVGGMAAPLVSL